MNEEDRHMLEQRQKQEIFTLRVLWQAYFELKWIALICMVEIIRNWTVRSKNYFSILFKFAFMT